MAEDSLRCARVTARVAQRCRQPPGLASKGWPCASTRERQFTEGRQIQAGCACPENRTGLNPGSEHYRRLPPNLNHQPYKYHETDTPLPKPTALSQEL